MTDGRKGPWSPERRAAHSAKIRAALSNGGAKKTGKVKKRSRWKTVVGTGNLTDLMNRYDLAREEVTAAKQAIIDHLSQ